MSFRLPTYSKFKELFTISTSVNILIISTALIALGLGFSNGVVLHGISNLKTSMITDKDADAPKNKIVGELNYAIGYGEALHDFQSSNEDENYAASVNHFENSIHNIIEYYDLLIPSELEISALSNLQSALNSLVDITSNDGSSLIDTPPSFDFRSKARENNEHILITLQTLREERLIQYQRDEANSLESLMGLSNYLAISVIGIVVILIVLNASVWFMRVRIITPVKHISAAMKSLIEGKLFTKIPDVYQGDEISDLAKGIDNIRGEMVRRIHAEETLRITQNHFEGIMSLSTVAIITIDENLNIQTFNKGAEAYFGYDLSAVIGQPLNMLLPARHRANHAKHIEGFLNGPEIARSMLNRREIAALRRDGSEFPVEASISKIGYGGKSTLTVILNDVTERIKREEEISKGRDLLRATIDNFPGGIAVIGDDLTFQSVNEMFFDLPGLKKEDFPIGCTYRSFVLELAKLGWYGEGNVEEIADELVRNLNMVSSEKFMRESPSGKVIDIRSTPLPGGGIVRTYFDITKEKAAELELRNHRDHLADLVEVKTAEIQKNAEELEEALRQEKEFSDLQQKFISLASHELRTPLTIIDSVSQRLIRKKDKINEEGYLESRIEKIRQAVARMVSLIESTLMASRLEAGKIEGHFDQINLTRLIEVISRRQQDIDRSHEIVMDLKNLPKYIIGDETLLDNIFTNLLSNAVKYSPNNPLVEIKGWVESSQIVVSVTDHGVGVSEKDLPHLFKRFFRASTAEGIKGTGIGLVVVKDFVELHEGEVHVDSIEGQGTSFIVRLPIEGPKNLSNSFEDIATVDDDQDQSDKVFVA